MLHSHTQPNGALHPPPVTLEDWRDLPERGDYFERWSLEKVEAITDKGKTAIYTEASKGLFPKPQKDGRRTYWVSTQIIAWLHAQLRGEV